MDEQETNILNSLLGRTIVGVDYGIDSASDDELQRVLLHLDDGRIVRFEGGGGPEWGGLSVEDGPLK